MDMHSSENITASTHAEKVVEPEQKPEIIQPDGDISQIRMGDQSSIKGKVKPNDFKLIVSVVLPRVPDDNSPDSPTEMQMKEITPLMRSCAEQLYWRHLRTHFPLAELRTRTSVMPGREIVSVEFSQEPAIIEGEQKPVTVHNFFSVELTDRIASDIAKKFSAKLNEAYLKFSDKYVTDNRVARQQQQDIEAAEIAAQTSLLKGKKKEYPGRNTPDMAQGHTTKFRPPSHFDTSPAFAGL